MQIAITTEDARAIYVQIMDEIRRAVVLGTLRPDDPLPSLRQLAANLRVNPNTVAQAYRELERDGVVYVRRGQGTFIARTRHASRERGALVEGVAKRALLDAHRNGIAADELIDAIRAAATESHSSSPVAKP